MFVTARPLNLQKQKTFRPNAAAANTNRYSNNTPSTTLSNTNINNVSTLNLNKLTVNNTTPQAVQQSTNDTQLHEYVPVYAPTNDQLQNYYHIAKFMTSAVIDGDSKKKLSRHAKLYKPVRNKHKSYALIAQEKKLERAKRRQMKRAGQLPDNVELSSDSDDDEKQILRKWRIDDSKRNLSFIGTAEQLRTSVSRDTSGNDSYALLIMQYDSNNKPYFDMVPVSRFINFRGEEQYQHVRTLDEAEAYMRTNKKLGDRWMSRSAALKKYETEKLLDMEEQGVEIDRELVSAKLADIDDSKLQQRLQKIEQQRSRLKLENDTDRRVKKERAHDFTQRFSDDEDAGANDDVAVEDVQSDDSAAFDSETEEIQTDAGKRSTELLQKQDTNQLPQAVPGDSKTNNDIMADDSDDSGIEDDGDFDDDDLYISDSDAMDTGEKPNVSPVLKRPSPLTQRSTTPQPPTQSTRKRRTDTTNNTTTQNAAIDSSKKPKVDDSILTQQDIINTFKQQSSQTVSDIAAKLTVKLKDPNNRIKLADYIKQMCTIKDKQLTLMPQYVT